MSHFIICSNATSILGTPNGHASTQFEQAMQRGFSDVCTTPSSFCLMASAGQTCAQVGFSQCMQTIGVVAIDCARSMLSTWIIGTPRCVSHSAQAFSQDRQPMQRDGSTKKASPLMSADLGRLPRRSRPEPPEDGGWPALAVP